MAQKVAAFLIPFALCSAVWLASQASRQASATGNPATLLPKQQASYSHLEDILLQILAEMRGIRSDLKVAVASGQVRTDGALVAQQRCSACHAEGNESKGDGVILLGRDGLPRNWSSLERRHIREKLEKGLMPPTGKLPPNELKAMLLLLERGQP